MPRTVVVNVVGLTERLLASGRMPRLAKFATGQRTLRVAPVLPAVTCSAQATYLTGKWPREHGVVGNGWYDRDLAEHLFWSCLLYTSKASTPAKLAAKYQWYLNGKMLRNSTKPKLTVVSGVTTNTLKLSKVQPAAAGSYTVQVTNLLGTTTSSAAKVTVSGS